MSDYFYSLDIILLNTLEEQFGDLSRDFIKHIEEENNQ
jgi:hypothetical protein